MRFPHRPRLSFAFLALLTACAPDGAGDVEAQRWPNVYGVDDRQDAYETHDRLSADENALFDRIGRETVGMFVRDRHVRLDDHDRILLCGSNVEDYPAGREDGCFTRTLDWSVFSSSSFGDGVVALCADEPYRLQPKIGRCSGTLIADDLVLTSGHCFDELDDAETSVFVFGWQYEEAGGPPSIEWRGTPAGDVAFWIEQPTPGLATIARDDVYHVTRAHFLYETAERTRPSGTLTTSTVTDYAIVELDRPVSLPRHPAVIDYSATPPPGTELVVAGFGKGMPLKIDDGARLISSWYCDPAFNPAIVCNLHDGYSGSSGSGVFTRDGALVGAHRGSATDFVLDDLRWCFRSNVVPDPVPDTDFPAAAHSAAWAVEEFCRNGFETDSPLCGDPAHREASCPGDSIESVGGQVCCERACAADADCAADGWGGACDPVGHCRRAGACFSGELWERDACGRPAHRIEGSATECLASGDACSTAEPLEAVDQRITLSVEGLRDHSQGSCGGEYGRERVFEFTLDATYDVTVSLDGAALDWLLYLRGDTCEETDELFCGVSDRSMDSSFDGRLDAGTYYVFVDTRPGDADRGGSPTGPELELTFRLPAGDGGVGGMERRGGCSCEVAPRSPSRLWLLALSPVALLFAGSRRRR